MFLPYAAAIDEFQEYIYCNPNISRKTRDVLWRDLERKYMPWRDYDFDDFSVELWHQQGHVFFSPFYYIDYALAQISALEIGQIFNQNKQEGWDKYLKICTLGGSVSYLESLRIAKLKTPFDEQHFKEIIDETRKWFKYMNNILSKK